MQPQQEMGGESLIQIIINLQNQINNTGLCLQNLEQMILSVSQRLDIQSATLNVLAEKIIAQNIRLEKVEYP